MRDPAQLHFTLYLTQLSLSRFSSSSIFNFLLIRFGFNFGRHLMTSHTMPGSRLKWRSRELPNVLPFGNSRFYLFFLGQKGPTLNVCRRQSESQTSVVSCNVNIRSTYQVVVTLNIYIEKVVALAVLLNQQSTNWSFIDVDWIVNSVRCSIYVCRRRWL